MAKKSIWAFRHPESSLGKLVYVLGLLTVFAWSAGTRAELIVYEGFDYPADKPLVGNEGGTGWDQPWTGGGMVLSPGLTYGELNVEGNTGAITVANDPAFREIPLGFSALNRTIWISFLAQEITAASFAGISTFNGVTESLFMGSIWDTNPPRYWGVRIYNILNDTDVDLGPAYASTIQTTEKVFFVARIANSHYSARMTLWLNPGLDGEPNASEAWFDRTVGRIPFDTIRLNSWADNAVRYDYDEIRIGDSYADVAPTGTSQARRPRPGDGLWDVARDAILHWQPGLDAQSHDVYLGTIHADVNTATRSNPLGVLVSKNQDAKTYDPVGLLDFGQTYYWRVDEVTVDQIITQGKVWQFESEPKGYPITGTSIVATASSSQAGSGPEKTINGSGLDAQDGHSTLVKDMWQSAAGAAEPVWIQYAFDKIYKLHEMWVWNYNGDLEFLAGFGLKEVTLEHSLDGSAWTVLGTFTFNQGASTSGYTPNTTVDFKGAAARYVRLVVKSSFGSSGRHGLSEVRFFYIPTWARQPQPASAAKGVDTDVVLTWRSGRDAVYHDVYFSTEKQAVAEGTTLVGTMAGNRYAVDTLELGKMYYWKVNEVNTAEPISTWEGDVWDFTTQDFYLVDGFETYTDNKDDGQTIWQTWDDGIGTSDNGSQVGHTSAPYAETTIVHGGGQSMLLFYDNQGVASLSEAVRTFAVPQDWTRGGAKTLVLYFQGSTGNTGRLYVKINNAKVLYPGAASDLAQTDWIRWTIDLNTVGTDLTKVTKMTIGVDNGGMGTLYIDDIRLYRVLP